MYNNADILENEILEKYPGVLEALIRDHTTQRNIFWATDNYEQLGTGYKFNSEIQVDKISGENGSVIMPRVKKNKELQQSRVREMAEVFTPSWICNAQNNLIDNAWFGREKVFNLEINEDETRTWKTTEVPIEFSGDKDWKEYVRDKRLEMTCGEAPYITSRYDTTAGEFIPVENRIGLLDRKLRVVNENCSTSGEWLKAAQQAYMSIYAFEWQGDSLLLAREAMLITFIENYVMKFDTEPLQKSITYIAYIISWNVWQMDGLKGTIPNTCGVKTSSSTNLFGEVEVKKTPCEGCKTDNIKKHNGIYALVKDWANKDKSTGKKGRKLRFIDLIN